MAKSKNSKSTKAEGDEAGEEGKGGKKSKKKLIAIILVVVVVLGAGYELTAKKKKPVAAGAATATTLPKGPILSIDPTTINLADGHFLEVGLGLQIDNTKDLTTVTNDEALALNDAIAQLSKDTMAILRTPAGKAKAQTALAAMLGRTFDKKVTAVYFTDFVMQ